MTILPTLLRLGCLLWLAGTGVALAQTPAPTPDTTVGEATPSVSPSPAPDVERANRLERFRVIIENRNDSMATRIAQAEELLETAWPEAIELVVRLLHDGDDAAVKSILCQAITNLGRRSPQQLNGKLVDPLLALLTHPDDEVIRRAGEALSTFADAQVIELLSDAAASTDSPLRTRLTALAALTPNTHRREVVGALVELLSAQQPQVIAGAVAALRTVSAIDYGNDVARWQLWWKDQGKLSETQWLEALVRVRTQRLLRTEEALAQLRTDAEKRYTDLAGRLTETIAALYRQTPQAERDTAIIGWLADPSPEFRRAAAKLVAEQISEGNLPSDAVRAALVKRYADDTPEVRRLAVEIVGALNEPSDATALLERLKIEQEESTRETVLRVLGKLRNADAVAPLIEELVRPDAPASCVAAAADALGTLAARGGIDESYVAGMIEPLKSRFARTPPQSRKVRIAILGAMAATRSPEFKPEFEDHLAEEDTELLLRAIQGIAVVGNGSQLDRLSNLATHPDARVRQRAIAAIGDLGGADQLSAVVARMSPGVETVEGPRQAAWQAFRDICERQPLAAQVSAADRLVDLPDLRVQYLKALNDRLVKATPVPAELARVREMLARTLTGLQRQGEAMSYWQALFADAVAANNPRRTEWALAYLECALLADKSGPIPDILSALVGADERARKTAENSVVAFIEKLRASGRDKDAADLGAKLAGLPADQYPALKGNLPVMAGTSGLP